jgi:Flp pilus assembly protein TadB
MTQAPVIALTTADWLPMALAVAVAGVAVLVVARRSAPAGRTEAPPPAQKPRAGIDGGTPFLVGVGIAAALWLVLDRPGPAAAFMAAWYAALVLLRARRRSREHALQEAFALAAIGTASRALRAGVPLPGVIEILAREAEGDAGTAFREIVQREAMGEDLSSAVRRVLLPASVPSLRAFGLALSVQLGSGGNIVDTAERLVRSLVERARVRRRARTAVAYGRAAAIVLGLLPLLVIPVLSSSVEGYAEFLFDRPIGNTLLAASAMLVATGLITVQRLCRLEDAPRRAGQ